MVGRFGKASGVDWSGRGPSGVERAPSMLAAGKYRVRRGLLFAAPELQNAHATLKGRGPQRAAAHSAQSTAHVPFAPFLLLVLQAGAWRLLAAHHASGGTVNAHWFGSTALLTA